MDKTYTVTRLFRDSSDRQIIAEGLSLEEAREICKDPESSSQTCEDPELVELTERCGPWFNGFSEE